MIETFVGRTDTRALYKSPAVIDTTTTQMTSPSAEGPRSLHIAYHRVAGSRLTVAAQAHSCGAPRARTTTSWRAAM